jgi:hypothetical protein
VLADGPCQQQQQQQRPSDVREEQSRHSHRTRQTCCRHLSLASLSCRLLVRGCHFALVLAQCQYLLWWACLFLKALALLRSSMLQWHMQHPCLFQSIAVPGLAFVARTSASYPMSLQYRAMHAWSLPGASCLRTSATVAESHGDSVKGGTIGHHASNCVAARTTRHSWDTACIDKLLRNHSMSHCTTPQAGTAKSFSSPFRAIPPQLHPPQHLIG